MQSTDESQLQCIINWSIIDDCAKDGGPAAVSTLCSFNHNPLWHGLLFGKI